MKLAYNASVFVSLRDRTGNPTAPDAAKFATFEPIPNGHCAALRKLLGADVLLAEFEHGGHEVTASRLHVIFAADDLKDAAVKLDGALAKLPGIDARTQVYDAKPPGCA